MHRQLQAERRAGYDPLLATTTTAAAAEAAAAAAAAGGFRGFGPRRKESQDFAHCRWDWLPVD